MAAVQLESRLDRAEMLQKAKAIAEKQQVAREAKEALDDINAALDRLVAIRLLGVFCLFF